MSNKELNKLLLKQIFKKVGGIEQIPADLRPLLEVISQSYDHYERERLLTERSMDLSSKELMEANEKMSAQTKQLQKSNDELKQFGYAVSHDLKEPLRTIAGYIQLIELRTKEQLADETREFMQFAVSGVKQMKKMLEAMLQYAQVDGMMSSKVPINLNVVIDIVKSNTRESLISSNACFNYPTNLPFVNGYETQLVLLFQNILSNSIKFRSTQPLQIDLTYRTLNKNHLFSFQDNGIGIPEKEHDRVFNLFKRVHNNLDYEGIGMGLSICKKIIENHGGEMWIEKTPNNSGCLIYFTLPCFNQ